jgi:Fibronectin type III domain
MQINKQIKYVLALLLIVFPTTVLAASVTLRWQANTEPDISGYNLYYGTEEREYGLPIPVSNVTSHTIDNLVEGATYYFALTAVDTSGNESGYSTEVTANATSTEPATEDYQLLLSTNSDHSNAVTLNGQSISGDVYIYLDPEAYVAQVVFSIDGQTHNTENYAPYDLGIPFDTTSLANGTHTISALVRLQDGSTEMISADCSVSNTGSSTVENDAISLPSTESYGRIRGGDQTHVNEVSFNFSGMAGDVTLAYRVWDIDINDEVRIYVNGSPVDYAPETSNERWSGDLTLRLPDSLVNDNGTNIVVFNNTYNPPNSYFWGVGNVSVE